MTAGTVAVSALSLGVLAIAGAVSVMPRTAHAAPADTKVLTFYILPDEQGLLGPGGKHHDTFLPSNLVVHRGVPVTFRFVNYDNAAHTMTAPGLGLNVVIAAAAPAKSSARTTSKTGSQDNGDAVAPGITTYRFTPATIGQFRWHCNMMCDPWAMHASYDGPGRDGFMAGYIVVRK